MPVPLDSLRPNPANPRAISLTALKALSASLKRDPAFMALRPLLVDQTGLILAGNQRYVGLRDLGYTEVPDDWVRRVPEDLTPDQRDRLILLDNGPEGMSGHWDVDLLLQEWSPKELGELGLDLSRYGLSDLRHLPGHLGPGQAPPAPPKPTDAWKTLRVHFARREDLDDFNRRTGLSVTEETDVVRFD